MIHAQMAVIAPAAPHAAAGPVALLPLTAPPWADVADLAAGAAPPHSRPPARVPIPAPGRAPPARRPTSPSGGASSCSTTRTTPLPRRRSGT